MFPSTFKQWAQFTAAVFVAGVAIGTLANFFPALRSIGTGINLRQG